MYSLCSRGSSKKGDKIRIGYLTPPFSGGQKRAESPRNVLGGPGRGDKIRIGYITLCLLGGPEEGRIVT